MSRAAKGEGSVIKVANGYRGYVTVNGKRKYTPIFKTKPLAAQAKRELLTRKDDGRLVAGKVATVEQWMRHWLENVAKLRPTTFATNTWITEKKVIPELGTIKLNALTAERLEQWVSDLGVAPSSQRRYLAPLRAALTVAFKRGHIPFNPASRVELGAIGKGKATAFSREDRDAILAAATGYNAARWHLSMRMGLRPAEVLGLTWQNFDVKAGTLTITHQLLYAKGAGLYHQPEPKTEAGDRRIQLPKTLAKLIVEQRRLQMEYMAEMGAEWQGWQYGGAPVALMFTQDNGRPIQARMDTQRWKKLLASAGLDATRRYQSRHTAATHLIVESGGDVAVTADILGHADSGFTYRTYVHPLEERKRALAAKMDEPSAPYAAPYEAVDSLNHPTSAESAPERLASQ
jgi:integrase